MCLICIEFQKNTLTIPEARRNLQEMRDGIGEVHAQEVDTMVHKRVMEELDDLLKDFDPFIDPPKPTSEMSDIEYVRNNIFCALRLDIRPSDDEPLDLELDDIPTSSW